jgi:hypothetical protein
LALYELRLAGCQQFSQKWGLLYTIMGLCQDIKGVILTFEQFNLTIVTRGEILD